MFCRKSEIGFCGVLDYMVAGNMISVNPLVVVDRRVIAGKVVMLD